MDTSALTALSTIMDTSDPVVFASVATAALVLFLFIWRIIFFFTADGTSFPLPVPLVLFIRCVFVFPTADGRKFVRADLTLLLKGPPPQEAFEDKVVWITGASQGIVTSSARPPFPTLPAFPPTPLCAPPPSVPLPPLRPSPLCAPPPSASLPLPGQELAQRFAAMGARLILSSRSAERLEAVRASCRGKHAPEGIVVLPFDLKRGADVLRGAVRQAESAFRGEGEGPCGVDVLVLNAAHPRPKLTCEDTPEDTLRKLTCEDTPEDTLRHPPPFPLPLSPSPISPISPFPPTPPSPPSPPSSLPTCLSPHLPLFPPSSLPTFLSPHLPLSPPSSLPTFLSPHLPLSPPSSLPTSSLPTFLSPPASLPTCLQTKELPPSGPPFIVVLALFAPHARRNYMHSHPFPSIFPHPPSTLRSPLLPSPSPRSLHLLHSLFASPYPHLPSVSPHQGMLEVNFIATELTRYLQCL
ncbi:unnamed protein product, partial [Closterium sp. NIES-65]